MKNSCLHRNSKTLKIINFVFASGRNLLLTELAVYNDTYDYLKMKNWACLFNIVNSFLNDFLLCVDTYHVLHPGQLCSSKEIRSGIQLGKVLFIAVFELRATEGRQLEGTLPPRLQQGKSWRNSKLTTSMKPTKSQGNQFT